jgi:RimJ/RimL family protein N-acetyltransferase
MHDFGMGDHMELRPAAEVDLLLLEKLTWDPAATGDFAQFGWFDLRMWRQQWAENKLIGDDGGALMVVRGNERLGFVNWHRQPSTPAASYWEIGIALLPEARGHGYATQALGLLARYLFAHTTAHRIEATIEAGNVASRRAVENAGFTQEGVLRESGWRDGAWRDGVIYSLLRTDPTA